MDVDWARVYVRAFKVCMQHLFIRGTIVGGKISAEKFSLRVGVEVHAFPFMPFRGQVQIHVSRCFLNWNLGDYRERWAFCQEISPSLVISSSLLQPSLGAGNVCWVCQVVVMESSSWRKCLRTERSNDVPQPRHNKVLCKSDHVRCDVYIDTDY